MSIVTNPFDHILYEIEMYLYTYQLIQHNMPSQPSVNLILDSRAIYLRNLAYFFHKEKKRGCWSAFDYVNDPSILTFLDDTLFQQVNDNMSRATGHLLDYRLEESYKENTKKCFKDAYPSIIDAIKSFFDAMDHNAKIDYQDYWNNIDICNRVKKIKNLIKSLEYEKKYIYETVTTCS